MSEESFEQRLNDLREGKIEEISVGVNDFTLFRESWKKLPDRVSFVGEAGLNGQVVYRYKKNEE